MQVWYGCCVNIGFVPRPKSSCCQYVRIVRRGNWEIHIHTQKAKEAKTSSQNCSLTLFLSLYLSGEYLRVPSEIYDIFWDTHTFSTWVRMCRHMQPQATQTLATKASAQKVNKYGSSVSISHGLYSSPHFMCALQMRWMLNCSLHSKPLFLRTCVVLGRSGLCSVC